MPRSENRKVGGSIPPLATRFDQPKRLCPTSCPRLSVSIVVSVWPVAGTPSSGVIHHLKPVSHIGGFRRCSSVRSMRTFCRVSSRADTARTRRRLLRLALAPAPRARRAAGARHGRPDMKPAGVTPGKGRRALCGAAPQRRARCASRSDRSLRASTVWAVTITVGSGSRPEGPGGSGVNGLTPGPHDSSAG